MAVYIFLKLSDWPESSGLYMRAIKIIFSSILFCFYNVVVFVYVYICTCISIVALLFVVSDAYIRV